uniref:Helicase n=1 Tax=Wad Medani virus TaxID=40067 RepID=A0A3G1RP39_9REOV|nr:helicase [Wad Medani virus]
MSVRLILLAPGDLIASVEPELTRRHIDCKYNGSDNDSSNPRRTAEDRKTDRGDRELLREHPPGGGGDGGGDSGGSSSKSLNGARGTDKPGVGSRPDERKAPESNPKHGDTIDGKETGDTSQGNSHTSGDKVASRDVDDALNLAAEAGQDSSRRVFALTESIVGALRDRGSFHVQLPGDSEPRDGDVCYHIGAAALKALGLPPAEALAQKDAETHWRKQLGKKLAITKIHSPGMLEKLFPLAAPERQHRTSVALVTNLEEYVPRAHVIFTAPTGDSNWKKIAREATKRTNIRAYAHDPSAGAASEALLALIDAL